MENIENNKQGSQTPDINKQPANLNKNKTTKINPVYRSNAQSAPGYISAPTKNMPTQDNQKKTLNNNPKDPSKQKQKKKKEKKIKTKTTSNMMFMLMFGFAVMIELIQFILGLSFFLSIFNYLFITPFAYVVFTLWYMLLGVNPFTRRRLKNAGVGILLNFISLGMLPGWVFTVVRNQYGRKGKN
ncbi:MAG: hypothetical protein ACOCU8_01775 [Patescibacteria group bacterium]